jgi:hypothetical protein
VQPPERAADNQGGREQAEPQQQTACCPTTIDRFLEEGG